MTDVNPDDHDKWPAAREGKVPPDFERELQRAHVALQRQRRAHAQVEAPTLEALQSLVDGTVPLADREALLERVFASGASEELALLQSVSASATISSEHITADTVLLAATPSSNGRRFWPLAAAAALLIVASVPVVRSLRTDTDVSTRYRGADSTSNTPHLRDPLESAAGRTFVWSAVPAAERYSLELLDANAEVVLHVDTRDTTITVDDLSASVPQSNDAVKRDSANGATTTRDAGGPDTASLARRATSWWVIAQLRTGDQRRSAVRELVRRRD